MTIAIDAEDMGWVRSRLRDAAAKVDGAVPAMPGAAAFGPATLASAVASFEAAVRRDARALRDRWTALDEGVAETFDELDAVDSGFVAEMRQVGEALA